MRPCLHRYDRNLRLLNTQCRLQRSISDLSLLVTDKSDHSVQFPQLRLLNLLELSLKAEVASTVKHLELEILDMVRI